MIFVFKVQWYAEKIGKRPPMPSQREGCENVLVAVFFRGESLNLTEGMTKPLHEKNREGACILALIYLHDWKSVSTPLPLWEGEGGGSLWASVGLLQIKIKLIPYCE